MNMISVHTHPQHCQVYQKNGDYRIAEIVESYPISVEPLIQRIRNDLMPSHISPSSLPELPPLTIILDHGENADIAKLLSQQGIVKRRTNYATATENTGGPAFSQTKKLASVFAGSDKGQEVVFDIQARIDKGFFLHDNDWTCYRRNYFQVSGCFNSALNGDDGLNPIVPAAGQFVVVGDKLYNVNGYRLGVSAHMSGSDKQIGLVQHTSKRDKGPQNSPVPKFLKSGGSFSSSHYQDLMMAVSNQMSPDNGALHELPMSTIATFERLQFKSATANNGKRRAAQQYFAVDVELFAQYDNLFGGYDLVKVASVTSTCLVVRGRSPSHYSESEKLAKSPYSAPRMNRDAYFAQTTALTNVLVSANMNHHLAPEQQLPQFDYSFAGQQPVIAYQSDVLAQYKPTVMGDIADSDLFGAYRSPSSTVSINHESVAFGELPSASASVPYLLGSDHYSPLHHDIMSEADIGRDFSSHASEFFQTALDF